MPNTVEKIVASNQTEKEINQINNIEDIKNLTVEESKKLAEQIVSDSKNQEQAKGFPEYLNNYGKKQRADFISKLEQEIKAGAEELRNLWIEEEDTEESLDENAELSEKDVKNLKMFQFVEQNRGKIRAQWEILKNKADEIKRDMEEWIKKEWIDYHLQN